MQALEALKAALALEIENDPDFLLDLAEGETSLLEILDAMLEADAMDEGLIDGAAVAAAKMADRKERFTKRRAARRVIIEQALVILERNKLERPCATVSMANRAPQVIVTDESALPSQFFKSVPTLDKKALKAALDAGEAVPGATLSNGSASLTIRRR
jgi:hypothetical protein